MEDRWSTHGLVFALGLVAGSAISLLLGRHTPLSTTNNRSQGNNDDSPGRSNNRRIVHEKSKSQQNSFECRRQSDPHTPQSITRLPPEIRSEMLSRNRLYFSSNGISRIEASTVLVVGLGGVGSHTAHMLARSGVGYLRLVDFDQVTLSSLNRHAVATLQDVGLPKATVLGNHLRNICPDREKLILDPRVKMYTGDREKDGTLLDPPLGRCSTWDLIIDAIDDVPTKAALIAYCAQRGIRVLSCMGAGGKADPTRVHISDLRSASRDPLATAVRQKLRLFAKKEGKEAMQNESCDPQAAPNWISCIDDDSKVAVVYSSEKVVAKLAQITEEQKEEGLHNFGAIDNMRVRVLPVVGTMPAIMGQTLAAMALCELGNKPFSPVGAERVGRNVRHRIYQHLKQREKKLEQKLRHSPTVQKPINEGQEKKQPQNGDDKPGFYASNGTYVGPIEIDPDDVEYLMAELWRNKCAITGDRLGNVLELIRWNRTLPATPNNLVLMGVKAATKFDKDFDELGDGREGLNVEIRKKVEKRLAMCVLGSEEL